MSYLALDDVTRLTRGDWVRLGLVTRPGDPETLPYYARALARAFFRGSLCAHERARIARLGFGEPGAAQRAV